jgi:hypothetical protein
MFLAVPRDCFLSAGCSYRNCENGEVQPTYSVGVGGRPKYYLASAMMSEPFEATATNQGIHKWRRLAHLGVGDVPKNFLIRKLRDEARIVWDNVYSNQ